MVNFMLAFVRFWWNKYWVLQSDVLLMWFVKFPVKPTLCVRVSAHQTDPLNSCLSSSFLIVAIYLYFKTYTHTHKVTMIAGDLQTAWSFWPLTSSLGIIQHFSSNPLSATDTRCPPKSSPLCSNALHMQDFSSPSQL